MNFRIKKAQSQDWEVLQDIGCKTFFETYAEKNTEKNMQEYLRERFSKEQMLKELTDKNSEFYFALVDHNVAGYLKLNTGTAQTEIQNQPALEIERIYVLNAFQNQKIGLQLLQYAVNCAKAKGAAYVWLGVWEENPKAIGFYTKHGFVAYGTHIYRVGKEDQKDFMMRLML